MQAVDVLLERLLIRCRSGQLQDHMIHQKIIRDCTPVVFGLGFGASVTGQNVPVVFIDRTVYQGRARLCGQNGKRCQKQNRQL